MSQLELESLQVQRSLPIARSWTRLGELALVPRRLARRRIVSFSHNDPASSIFDILRTKVLKSSRQDKWRRLGVTSPTRGCGKSTVAVNLAFSLAKQHDLRIALLDLDLRQPRVAKILSHKPKYSTQTFLRDECLVEEFVCRIGENLAVGASPDSAAHPAELLHAEGTADALDRMQHDLDADMVICNLPPMLGNDDCMGFLPQVNRALLVVGAEFSTTQDIDLCERDLAEEAKLLGVVLNRCHYRTER